MSRGEWGAAILHVTSEAKLFRGGTGAAWHSNHVITVAYVLRRWLSYM